MGFDNHDDPEEEIGLPVGSGYEPQLRNSRRSPSRGGKVASGVGGEGGMVSAGMAGGSSNQKVSSGGGGGRYRECLKRWRVGDLLEQEQSRWSTTTSSSPTIKHRWCTCTPITTWWLQQQHQPPSLALLSTSDGGGHSKDDQEDISNPMMGGGGIGMSDRGGPSGSGKKRFRT